MSEWIEKPKPEIMRQLERHCVALWLVEYPKEDSNSSKPGIKFIGGSAFLWQSMHQKFLVTAHHVWAEFKERIQSNPERHLIFYLDGDHAIPISKFRIVSENADLDLVVIGGPGIESLKLEKKEFFQQQIMPPGKVSSDDRLAIVGYPKDLRIPEKPYNTIGVMYMQGSAITSEYGLRFRMTGNPPNKFKTSAIPSLNKLSMPGTSGGPVFAFRESRIEWVGIVSEGGEAPHFDFVISPSYFISSDGIITP